MDIIDLKNEKWAILFGAGISIDSPSYLPSGVELSQQIIKNIVADKYIDDVSSLFATTPSQLRTGKFVRFERLVEILEIYYGNNNFLNFFGKYETPNKNHHLLSELSQHDVPLVTTNFDNLVEISSINKKELTQEVFDGSEVQNINSKTLYKLHGSSLKNSKKNKIFTTIKSIINHTKKQDNSINVFLKKLLREYNLIVVGYSGFDDFDISPLIQKEKTNKKIVWFEYEDKINKFEIADFYSLKNKAHSKSKVLLESIYTMGSRSSDLIYLVRGNTTYFLEKLLMKVSQNNISIPKQASNTSQQIDFRSEVDNYFLHNVTALEKTYFCTLLFNEVGKYRKSIDIIIKEDVSYKKINKIKAYLLTVFFKNAYMLQLEKENYPIDISTINDDSFYNVSKTVKAGLYSNMSLACIDKDMGLFDKLSKIALDLYSNSNSNDRIIPLINRGMMLIKNNEELFYYLKNKLLPLAKYSNSYKVLPVIYSNMARTCPNDDSDTYYEETIKYSWLASDSKLLMESIMQLSHMSPVIAKKYKAIIEDFIKVLPHESWQEKFLSYRVLANLSDGTVKKEEYLSKAFLEIENNRKSLTIEIEVIFYFVIEYLNELYNQRNFKTCLSVYTKYYSDLTKIHDDYTSSYIAYGIKIYNYLNKKDIVNQLQNQLKLIIKNTDDPNVPIYSLFESYYDIYDYENALLSSKLLTSLYELDSENRDIKLSYRAMLEIKGNIYFNKKNYYESKCLYMKSVMVFPNMPVSGALLYNLSRIEYFDENYINSLILSLLSSFYGEHDGMESNVNHMDKLNSFLSRQEKNNIMYSIKLISKDIDSLNKFTTKCMHGLSVGSPLKDLL